MKLGIITVIRRTKDSLWNTATEDHQHQSNSKPKLLLEAPCWLCSETMKVLHWLPGKMCHSEPRTLYWKHTRSQKFHQEEEAESDDFLLQQGLEMSEIVTTTHVIARLEFTLLPHPARISLLAISASSPNWRKPQRPKLQFWWRSQGCSAPVVLGERNRTELKNMLNLGKIVLKLEENL